MYKEGIYVLPKRNRCPQDIFPLLERCCDPDPQKRPSFQDLGHYFATQTLRSEQFQATEFPSSAMYDDVTESYQNKKLMSKAS